MGTKIGGLRYKKYTPFSSQNSLDIEKVKFSPLTNETRFEQIASNKLKSVQPDRTEMRELNQFSEGVHNAIRQELFVNEKHLFGSSVKNTMVESSHTKDIDILEVLDSDKHWDLLTGNNGAQLSLKKVKQSLEKNPMYFGAKITIDGSAVVVEQNGKIVDIVPAFRNPNGPGFLIPEITFKSKLIILI